MVTQDQIVPGTRLRDGYGSVYVMSVCGNWVMARRRGCVPFVKHINSMATLFDLDPEAKLRRTVRRAGRARR